MEPQRFLGVDPGLVRTGWAILEKNFRQEKPQCLAWGTLKTCTKHSLGARLLTLYQGLTEVLEKWTPLYGAIETPFVQKYPQSALLLGAARGVCLMTMAQHALKISEYTPNMMKKWITGWGHSQKESVKKLLPLWIQVPPQASTYDAVDAAGLAFVCMMENKSFS